MSDYHWYVNEHRQRLLDEIKKMPDKKDLSKIIEEALETYVKVHGSGNPGYSLDKFADPEFKMTPAFGESLTKWDSYLAKCSHKEVEEYYYQAQALLTKITKKEKELAHERS